MAIKDVTSKCWILALFIRDDGERFLLGDGNYEFDEKQLHFAANTMANDVVEVQGNDGYLLAGQVRRPGVQSFDGYIGDSSTPKAAIETHRQAFFSFFRKNYFYTVVYVFPDGTAIQRKRGFLVDAPVAQELYQIYPKYHVALNFEDINYYYYDEDASGTEIYGKSATITLNSIRQTGGLVWVDPSEIELSGEGTSFTLMNTVNGTALISAQLKGDTFQQTYSGKNLMTLDNVPGMTSGGVTSSFDGSVITANGTSTAGATYINVANTGVTLPAGTYTATLNLLSGSFEYPSTPTSADFAMYILKTANASSANRLASFTGRRQSSWGDGTTFTITEDTTIYFHFNSNAAGIVFSNLVLGLQIESGSTATSYEPYVGGIASPNPDYPQEVQTVTGRQVVTISDGGSQSQEYEVNLGKNLFDKDNANIIVGYIDNNHPTIISNANNRTIWIPCQPNTTYTIQKTPNSSYEREIGCSATEPAIGVSTTLLGVIVRGTDSATVTTSSDAKYLVIRLWSSAQDTSVTLDQMLASVQIEKGSTATSYAPYFEPIELCKISSASTAPTILTYQDYFYKENGEWYLHKEITKTVFDGTEAWQVHSNQWSSVLPAFAFPGANAGHSNSAILASSYSPVYITEYNSANRTYGKIATLEATTTSANTTCYMTAPNSSVTTLAQFKAWLAENPVSVYYASTAPTDTQITNADLIAQLEAVAGATTYNRLTTFVTQSQNLPAILAVEATGEAGGGVEWDADGAVWEEGQSSYSTVVVESIDNIYPILTITGRTVNPVITDVTTGTIFQYNGTITESQVLKVDMMNKTATLNGTSVVGNVSGDWLFLQPGNNKITYTADNATAPNATIEWQEIVG